MQANDLVMLVLGLPLLALSFWLARRGSLRGRLLLAGTLGFILYVTRLNLRRIASSAPVKVTLDAPGLLRFFFGA